MDYQGATGTNKLRGRIEGEDGLLKHKCRCDFNKDIVNVGVGEISVGHEVSWV